MTNNAWEWNWLDLYFIGAYILYLSNALFVRASGEIKGGCARVGARGMYIYEWLEEEQKENWIRQHTRHVSSRTETNCRPPTPRTKTYIDKILILLTLFFSSFDYNTASDFIEEIFKLVFEMKLRDTLFDGNHNIAF